MASILFLGDLLDLQTAWIRACEELARTPATAGTTPQRRRILALSCRISAHPYWRESGCSQAARVELRRQARARRWVEAA